MSSCIFCKIINREIPGKIAHESDVAIAFYDLNPVSPHHLLFIPKKHIESLDAMTEEDSSIISKVLFELSEFAKTNEYNKTGYRVVTNTGKDAGQTVFHIHFHLLAGREFNWPPG